MASIFLFLFVLVAASLFGIEGALAALNAALGSIIIVNSSMPSMFVKGHL